MNALVNMLPPQGRKILYGVLAAALSIYAIWQAVDGDWTQFSVSIATALVNIMAAGNVDTTGNSVTVATDTATGDNIAHIITADTEAHFKL